MNKTIHIVLLLLSIACCLSGGENTSGETLHPILLNRNSVTVPEGGSATFAVKLGFQPASETVVTIAVSAGDTDISVTNGANLIFTPGNWNIYQVVTLSAAEDNDNSPGISIITASSPGTKSAIIRATEKDNDFVLSILCESGGTSSPSGHIVLQDETTLNLEAAPCNGFHFKMWGVESGSSVFSNLYAASTTLTVSDKSTVKAYFETNTYTIEFSAGQNGSIQGTAIQQIPHGGDCKPVKAVPNTGFIFAGWKRDGELFSIENPLQIKNAVRDMEITAEFSATKYTVHFFPGKNGTISGANPQSVNYGEDSIPVEAIPDANFAFTGWIGDYTGIENPIILREVKAHKTVYAKFKIIDTDNDGMPDFWETKYGLDPNDPADANLDKDSDMLDNLSEYKLGTDPENPDTDGDTYSDGAEVVAWTDPLDPLSMPGYKIILEKDVLSMDEDSTASIGVKLSKEPTTNIKITLSLDGESHGVTLNSNPELTFTSENWNNWQYLEFFASRDDNPFIEITKFKLDAGPIYGVKTLQVVKKDTDLNVIISDNGNGKTDPKGIFGFSKGQALNATATPSLNYHFSHWTGVPIEKITDNPLNLIVEEPMTIFANFAEDTVKYRARIELDGFLTKWTFVDANFAGGYESDLSIKCPDKSPESFLDNFKIQGQGIDIREGFESETAGAVPAKWNFNSADLGTIRVVGVPVSEGQKALKISGTENESQELFYPGSISENDSTSSFDIYATAGTRPEAKIASVIYQGTSFNFNIVAENKPDSIIETATSNFSLDMSAGKWHSTIFHFDKMIDTDHDGLDDDWEILNFGNLMQDGDGDFDGDGVTNLQEFQDETDPKSKNAKFAFEKELTTVPESAGTVNIMVILSKPEGKTVSVNVGLLNASATDGEDFKFKPQTLTFASGTTVATASVTIINDDNLEEPDEEIYLALENPRGANIGSPSTHKITVKENAEDSDKDGLPDWWEMKFFGSLDQKPEYDPDNDGVSNIIEYKQGRHPNAGAKKDAKDQLELRVNY